MVERDLGCDASVAEHSGTTLELLVRENMNQGQCCIKGKRSLKTKIAVGGEVPLYDGVGNPENPCYFIFFNFCFIGKISHPFLSQRHKGKSFQSESKFPMRQPGQS